MQAELRSIDAAHLRTLLSEMGEEFLRRGSWAEIAVFGGAALLLHFGYRPSTRDIDYVPMAGDEQEMLGVARLVGQRHGLPEGWFNDAVSANIEDVRDDALHGTYPRFATEGGLRVFLASPLYILAMKLKDMRSSAESHDVFDVWNLLDHCAVPDAAAAERLIESFFPGRQLETRNKGILLDIIEAKAAGKAYDPMLGW